ncbi:MAG: Fur family transcriptional regulator [Dietzia sp.]|uniref:Fur family transcriptional regulator n=1 Tax=Dietzia TaxID=37914 RepID=UPI0015FA74C0|nr:Fur family transcriptional regulator [Dietzia sp.]MBB1036136.1 transcriptional repressor [Dietzia sp. CQ4]MBB1039290.1 transcriptional repressor [Dietzia natronolimnaea]MBB1041793.1 transcriptional repressor [Dietzia sp. Cai40]MBB1044667.1 transcriptional repressor [Dietzia sp. DQ11-44]MBB1056112.1 transcriptional repressor [Dietzia sp. B19]
MDTPDKSIGVRSTRQRSAISALLDESKGFRSAQDLHAELRERGDAIGLTTVYRTLQSMSDAGAVDVLRTDSGELIFRKCSDSHHHHLVCRVCGFTVEVEEPGVETWAHRAGGAHGFTEVTHTVELFGVCAACVAAGRGEPTGRAD